MSARSRTGESMRLTAALGLAAATSGCLVADFDLDRAIDEQRVPGSPISGLLDDVLQSPIPMDIDVSDETEARGTGPATAARLTRLELRVTDTARPSGDEDDFAFLESVDVLVESTREGSELPRVVVARARGEQGRDVLSFEVVPGVDLLPYVEEGSRFTSETEGSVPPDDVTFEGSYGVRIEVR